MQMTYGSFEISCGILIVLFICCEGERRTLAFNVGRRHAFNISNVINEGYD